MTAAQERKAARQLIAAAALAGDRLELADALEAVRAEETDRVAPKYRIETAAGSTWSHYAIATEPAAATSCTCTTTPTAASSS